MAWSGSSSGAEDNLFYDIGDRSEQAASLGSGYFERTRVG